MRALFDTHARIWWFSDDPLLNRTARGIIASTENTLLVSAASAWEIAIKYQLGKLRKAGDLISDFSGRIQRDGFQLLPISAEHAIRAGLLPGLHKDPFNRMLIAQAQAENLPVISNDGVFETYGVRRVW
ncbi:MAG TPA: type II toxin-antitoxin system VapC family toxin [Candidatus Acidoferrales bacterium]|nr:type II toxin-antitoxin system VapC family toxin [Candidatus Acidoferrales bacterium]